MGISRAALAQLRVRCGLSPGADLRTTVLVGLVRSLRLLNGSVTPTRDHDGAPTAT